MKGQNQAKEIIVASLLTIFLYNQSYQGWRAQTLDLKHVDTDRKA
jgi:hypothetical protein